MGVFAHFQNPHYSNRAEELGFNLAMPVFGLTSAVREITARLKVEQPIALHVRRGDYTMHARSFGLLTLDYYMRGVKELRSRGYAGQIWLFTDLDDGFADGLQRELREPILRIEKEYASLDGFEQFLVLREARAFVIANSSFSWWAARMAGPSAEVIVPEPWFLAAPAPDMRAPRWNALRASYAWE